MKKREKSKKEIFGEDYEIIPESWFSSLKANQKASVNKILRHIFPKDHQPKLVVDSTAHIGADTLNFAEIFQCHVIAIEKNLEAFEALKKNIQRFANPEKFTIVHDDIINWLQNGGHAADLYYFDPPWGGKEYVQKTKVPLYLDEYTIGQVANFVFEQNLTSHIIIKVPNNFDYDDFEYDYHNEYDVYDVKTDYGKHSFSLIHLTHTNIN